MYDYNDRVKFNVLKGKVFNEIKVDRDDSASITFITNEGEKYIMIHDQDCCEFVTIEDISGDTRDLINSEILMADEVSNDWDPPKSDYPPESYTWTFYKLATINGSVTIRWYGESNGYYSESVDLYKTK